MAILSKLVSLSPLVSIALAGTIPDIIPFTVTGGLDGCTADGTAYNSGGTINVNNFAIKVPENLIVQYPTAFSGFPDLCKAGTGGFETTVVGNIVNGQAIAGQVQVANRFGLEGSQGYIESINAEDSTIKIKGGPTVRINDPDGLFAKKVENKPLWAADTGSPSVASFSGFPMCIPYNGNKDSCLSSNRPANRLSFDAPDPLRMVPFQVGDFVEYAGQKDGDVILAMDMTAINVQVTTKASDTVPNYIRVEDMLVGVPDTAANVEFADIKVIGFLSSCSGAVVSIHAIDVDPCTGEEKLRQIGTATPKQEARCKWEARIASPAQAPFTREYLIKTNSPVIKTKDEIEAGQYVAAVGEWIFPEVDVPGTEPPQYRFTDIQGLVQGDFLDGKQYGQLKPWPGAAPPAPKKTCSPSDIPSENPNNPPTNGNTVEPVAAISQISAVQRIGTRILLAGSNIAQGLSNNDLTFEWTKTTPDSATVTIQNDKQPTATFVAPKVNAETSIEFELKVSLKSKPEVSSKAKVTVKVNPTLKDTVTMESYTWESRQSGTINVSCRSNVVNGDNKGMRLVLNGATTGLAMTAGPTTGSWTYSSRSTSRPNTLKCVSDLKGESNQITGTQTTARRRRRFSTRL